MSTSWHEEIERAYAELERSQEAIAQVQRDMSERTVTVTAPSRALTVVVDAQGNLTDLTFPTRAYRSMAGPELAALLIETIAQARRRANDELAEMFSAVLPQGTPIVDMLNGTADLDEMISDAVRLVRDQPGAPGTGRG
ncbi:YbaB/EbfC family nucleoid-associated protein [Micromonospora radicis]|uniref:YbaB/EbfC family DNA-binding protein n=1 Tax=Micromonospora radicis TaxID=1894971 RepID=A0A418MR03_9ACTN|nr:YbaB/EbfC family nucleoid-associated protein [Micromonospora radicis]RIV36052.1 YbaB/EbfC family DNA-binding protein [Micromonospora radicis]